MTEAADSAVADSLPALTTQLARAFAAYTADPADEAIDARATQCLTDFLGNALSATDLPWACQARAAVACAASGEASLIGTAERAACADAAFANAVAGHGLVRDDMHLGSVSHLGVVVVPTALALAETHGATGRSLLDAIVVGYEAGGRLGRALMDPDVARHHRPTGLIGPFAAAATAARLLALEEDRFAAALGLAANMAAGYNEWAAAGGTEMFFQPGFGARNGLQAVRLAQAGVRVSATALEGESGMLAAFGKQWPPGAAPFAGQAEILDVFFKEVPACNYAQTAAQAGRDLAGAEPFAAGDLEELIVRVPLAAARYPGCDTCGPYATVLQAKMSIQYNVAAALLRGHFAENNFVPSDNPDICEAATRVRIVVDDELTRAYPGRQGAEVSLRTVAGRRLSRQRKNVAPADATLIAARFREAARARLGAAAADALESAIDRVADLDTVAELMAHCRIATCRHERSAAR